MTPATVLALQLNGRSSVLRCNYGMALAKMGKPAEALAVLEEAIAADAANPLARFERAGVLLSQECFEEALAELQSLRVRLGFHSPGRAVSFQKGLLQGHAYCVSFGLGAAVGVGLRQAAACFFMHTIHACSCP